MNLRVVALPRPGRDGRIEWVSVLRAGQTAGRNRRQSDVVKTTRMLDSYQIISRPAHRPKHHHIEGSTMSVIDCDYLSEPEPIQFPPGLTLLIVWNARMLLRHSSNRRFTSSPRMPGAPFRGELNQGKSSGKCVCGGKGTAWPR